MTIDVDRTDDDATATACTFAVNDCSLRGAITAANANPGSTINLQSSATYVLGLAPPTYGSLKITAPTTINGHNATINANGIDRVFDIENAAHTDFVVTIQDLTITGGAAKGVLSAGGGINLVAATLNLVNVAVTGNTTSETGSDDNGGGIAANGVVTGTVRATLNLTNATVSNNTGLNGGGIVCGSCALTLNNSTVRGNHAKGGVGGGGIFVTGSSATAQLTNSTIIDNQSDSDGGAIVVFSGELTLTHNAIFGNSATNGGPPVFNSPISPGTITVPPPTLSSLDPSSAIVGSSGFTLTVHGTNLDVSSVVRWNGADRPTTYISTTQLQASISASDLAATGSYGVTVYNSAFNLESAPLPFIVNNPAPTITAIEPAAAIAGGPGFTLTVTGTNFITGAVVRWNGSDRRTSYLSPSRLTTVIPAADIAVAGVATLTVFNPAAGLESTPVSYPIINPAPSVVALSPPSVVAGSGAMTLTINGNNFNLSSQIYWNGAPRASTLISPTRLTVSVPASDLAASGTVKLTVVNPSPGGGTSNGALFLVTSPTPTLASIGPASAVSGGPAFTLTVTGTNFVPNSVLRFNGMAKPTTFVSPTMLTATVDAADIATNGPRPVQVWNPPPPVGGLSSNSLTFAAGPPPANPAPTFSAMSPTSAAPGSGGFTLTVTGTNFVSGSTVLWNGASQPTSYVSSTVLTATIGAADVASGGAASVHVVNPSPGGGTAGPRTFLIRDRTALSLALSAGTVAYANLVTYTVTLADADRGNAPISGQPVQVSVGGATVVALTNGTGQASGPIAVWSAAGVYTATASYAGSGIAFLLPASASQPFTVTAKTVQPRYTGPTVIGTTAGPLPLSATVAEPYDGHYGNRLDTVQVRFDLYANPADALDPNAAPTDSSPAVGVVGGPVGTASTSLAPPPAGVYGLVIKQVGVAGYYTLASVYPTWLVVQAPQGTSTTGQGVISTAASTVPTRLGLSGEPIRVTGGLTSTVQVLTANPGANTGGLDHQFWLTDVTSGARYRVVLTSTSRTGTGIGCVSGGACANPQTALAGAAAVTIYNEAGSYVGSLAGYAYQVEAVAGGRFGTTTYALTVTDAQGQLWYQQGTPNAMVSFSSGFLTTR